VTRRHGLGKDGVAHILAQQNGGCAICGVLYEDTPGKRLAMDHDHAHCPGVKGCPECVRGMLCWQCNNLLRSAGDDPARLRRAIAYLDRWSRRPVLILDTTTKGATT
jgi:hypothetical protein